MTGQTELFSLGEIWVSDFLHEGEEPRGGKHELKLIMEDGTRAVRLATTAPLNTLFGEYWYKSGLNESMRKELKDIVDSVIPLMKFKENSIFLDVASNDGTLLSYVPDSFIKIGIDPAANEFKAKAEKHADLIIQDFFSAKVYKESKFGKQKISVLTSIAVFYDIEDPNKFCQDVYEILDDEGLWVMQLSHSGLMIEQNAFDNILSEHIYYYTLSSLMRYLIPNGFTVVDCTLNDTNGGSFRVYIMKAKATVNKFGTEAYRDVCKYRVQSLLCYEEKLSLDSRVPWLQFYESIKILRGLVTNFIKTEKEKGKTFWAYAASTKGNTLLQWFKLDRSLIDGIAERSIDKWGLKTVATHIPIYSEDEMRRQKPDYVIILAWHFLKTFIEREKEYLDNGGKFIVTMPSFQIIEK